MRIDWNEDTKQAIFLAAFTVGMGTIFLGHFFYGLLIVIGSVLFIRKVK